MARLSITNSTNSPLAFLSQRPYKIYNLAKRIFSMNSLIICTNQNLYHSKESRGRFCCSESHHKGFQFTNLQEGFSQLSTRRVGTWFSLKSQCVACFYLQNNLAKYRLGTQSKVKDLVGNSSPNGNKKHGFRNLTQTSLEQMIGEVSSSLIILHDRDSLI